VTVTVHAGPTGRLADLLAAIRAQGGRWTTNRAFKAYRAMPALVGMPLGQTAPSPAVTSVTSPRGAGSSPTTRPAAANTP
jgi:hypothetical protein